MGDLFRPYKIALIDLCVQKREIVGLIKYLHHPGIYDELFLVFFSHLFEVTLEITANRILKVIFTEKKCKNLIAQKIG